VAGVIADAEFLLDQVSHPLAGPQRCLVAEFLRPFQQSSHQPLALLLVQQRLTSGTARRPQRFRAVLGDRLSPPAHRLGAHLHATGHFTLVESLPQQFQPFKPPLLQFGEIPLHASWITHVENDEAEASEVTLYYAGFSMGRRTRNRQVRSRLNPLRTAGH